MTHSKIAIIPTLLQNREFWFLEISGELKYAFEFQMFLKKIRAGERRGGGALESQHSVSGGREESQSEGGMQGAERGGGQ